MKASLLWLRDFLDRDVTAGHVRELLTARAATVESVVPVREDLSGIVIGRVVEVERHPDAEHLWLTKVDAGTGELLQVVCGAPSVIAGTSYPFAPVGATLPGGVQIEKRKIRGHTSAGMLCSAHELGLGTDHTGIMALEVDASPGAPFLRTTGIGDIRFDIDVLPNRPDLLAHEGLARELAAGLGMKLRSWVPPEHEPTEVPSPAARAKRSDAAAVPSFQMRGADGTTGGVRVRIDDTDGCPRYIAVVIRGVKIGSSPRWLVERLEGAGVRSINNVVDVTNFMLHGFGQPMHAFNLPRLDGEVTIRRAGAGERLRTLDGADRALTTDMTVIAGANAAEAIAGVIGGEGSEVGAGTTDILLEVAVFDPRRVRSTRRALGVSTEASYRFERHVDFHRLPERAALAAQLITRLAGGRIDWPPVDLKPGRRERAQVAVRVPRAALLLGDAIARDEIVRLLTPVGFEIKRDRKRETVTLTVPSWRSDIVDEVDVIEEIARLRGYDTFSSELRPFRVTSVPDDPAVELERRVRQALVACGLFETRPLPFVPRASDQRLRVRNPLAANEAYLRESLVQTLARRAEHNLAHMQRSVRLFEIGVVFARGEGPRPIERTHAGVLVMGLAEPPHFTVAEPRVYDVWDVKGIAEVVIGTAFPEVDFRFHVNRTEGRNSGGAGALSALPEVARMIWTIEVDGRHVGGIALLALDAPVWAAPAYALEIDLSHAIAAGRKEITYKPLPITPAAELDLALLVPDSVAAEAVERAMRRLGGDILEQALLFDEFRGSGIEPGMRSLAWRLTFRHPERTLRDREVESRKEKLVSALEAEFGVRPRTY